jgi:hypothetical protein
MRLHGAEHLRFSLLVSVGVSNKVAVTEGGDPEVSLWVCRKEMTGSNSGVDTGYLDWNFPCVLRTIKLCTSRLLASS